MLLTWRCCFHLCNVSAIGALLTAALLLVQRHKAYVSPVHRRHGQAKRSAASVVQPISTAAPYRPQREGFKRSGQVHLSTVIYVCANPKSSPDMPAVALVCSLQCVVEFYKKPPH